MATSGMWNYTWCIYLYVLVLTKGQILTAKLLRNDFRRTMNLLILVVISSYCTVEVYVTFQAHSNWCRACYNTSPLAGEIATAWASSHNQLDMKRLM